jgi:hypothetical protein
MSRRLRGRPGLIALRFHLVELIKEAPGVRAALATQLAADGLQTHASRETHKFTRGQRTHVLIVAAERQADRRWRWDPSRYPATLGGIIMVVLFFSVVKNILQPR